MAAKAEPGNSSSAILRRAREMLSKAESLLEEKRGRPRLPKAVFINRSTCCDFFVTLLQDIPVYQIMALAQHKSDGERIRVGLEDPARGTVTQQYNQPPIGLYDLVMWDGAWYITEKDAQSRTSFDDPHARLQLVPLTEDAAQVKPFPPYFKFLNLQLVSNLLPTFRVIDGLRELKGRVKTNGKYIACQELLFATKKKQAELLACARAAHDDAVMDTAVENEFAVLNTAQQNAASEATSFASPCTIIQGPPGTGKTHTIAAIVRRFWALGQDVHFGAPSNGAVVNFVRAMVKQGMVHTPLLNERAPESSQGYAIIVGNSATFPPDVKPYTLPWVVQRVKQTMKKLQKVLGACKSFEEKRQFPAQEWVATVRTLLPGCFDDLLAALHEYRTAVTPPKLTGSSYFKQQFGRGGAKDGRSNSTPKVNPKKVHEAHFKLYGMMRGMNDYNVLFARIMSHAAITLSTLNATGTEWMVRHARFSVLVVDEAGQASEAETIMALLRMTQCVGQEKLVLVGDTNQLGVFATNPEIVRRGGSRSLMERLMDLGYPSHLLNVQYRMDPQICQVVSPIFYEGKLVTGDSVPAKTDGSPIQVIHVDGREERDRASNSLKNVAEAKRVAHVVHTWLATHTDKTIAVLSAYACQAELLQKYLKQLKHPEVPVMTIDASQGQEFDAVVLSLVRSNPASIGFLTDPRRVNVGLTRAKEELFVVCRTLAIQQHEPWKTFVAKACPDGVCNPPPLPNGWLAPTKAKKTEGKKAKHTSCKKHRGKRRPHHKKKPRTPKPR